MDQLIARRRVPFALAALLMAIVTLAVFRLPELYVAQLERDRRLSSSQAGWAYRLLVAAAIAQAVYAGFVILRSERVRSTREKDARIAALPRDELMTSVARNAAALPVLTIVYGLAALWITGERGGFWLFVVLAAAQTLWYYRQTGDIGRWLGFQALPTPEKPALWTRGDADYCPPLARGLAERPKPEATTAR